MAADVQACLAFMVRFALFIVCKAKKHLYFYKTFVRADSFVFQKATRPACNTLVARLTRHPKRQRQMTNKRLVKTRGTILININLDNVFDFFANPCNDNLWRTEINQSTLDGTLQLGVTVSEYSNLSRKASNNLLKLKCVLFDKNKTATFETTNEPFYLKSERQVKAISENTTEIIYSIDFDIAIVKHALGFSLPKFIVSMKADSDMKKYLRQLKKQLG